MKLAMRFYCLVFQFSLASQTFCFQVFGCVGILNFFERGECDGVSQIEKRERERLTTTTTMMMIIDYERTNNAHRHISIIKRECERQMNDSINRARRRQKIRERERERERGKKKNRPLTEGYKQRTRTTRKKREEILRKQEGKKTKFSAHTSIVS